MNKDNEEIVKSFNTELLQLLNSKEYIRGSLLQKTIDAIKGYHFIKVYRILHEVVADRKVRKKYADLKIVEYQDACERCFIKKDIPDSNSSITIYTCITGKYDLPQRPVIIYPNYRYILFTDQTFDCNMGWEIKKTPDIGLTNPAAINRYLKFHPDEICDTDYAFYLDGNIRLMTGVSDFLKLSDSYYGIGMFKHYQRKCAYREADACICYGKGDKKKIKDEMRFYRKEGFPEMYGLKEAMIIGTDLRNEKAKELLHAWWNEYNKWGAGRDQLALPYLLWKDGHSMEDIFTFGDNMRNDPHFQLHPHLR